MARMPARIEERRMVRYRGRRAVRSVANEMLLAATRRDLRQLLDVDDQLESAHETEREGESEGEKGEEGGERENTDPKC